MGKMKTKVVSIYCGDREWEYVVGEPAGAAFEVVDIRLTPEGVVPEAVIIVYRDGTELIYSNMPYVLTRVPVGGVEVGR